MSEDDRKESLTIARLGLYATLIGTAVTALAVFADTDAARAFFSQHKPPTIVQPQLPEDSVGEADGPATTAPPPSAIEHDPLGAFVQLTEMNVRDRPFEGALYGLPYVSYAPRIGNWVGKICDGDVIVTVNDDAPPEDLARLGAALQGASTIQLRPFDVLESGPSANIEIGAALMRRC